MVGKVTFLEITFEKYVVALANACDENIGNLCRGSIYFLSGKATVSYPLEWIDYQREDGKLTPLLVNRFATDRGLKHAEPFLIELPGVKPEDFRRVESIDADAVSPREAGTLGGLIGVVGGAAIGFAAGAVRGPLAGATLCLPLLASAKVLATAAGAAAGGSTGYLLGRSMMTGLKLVGDVAAAQEEDIYRKTLALVVADFTADKRLMDTLRIRAKLHVESLLRDLHLTGNYNPVEIPTT